MRFDSYTSNDVLPARITYTWREYRNNNNMRELVREERSEYPHAGVLTTPAFLARYPTTETNRNPPPRAHRPVVLPRDGHPARGVSARSTR